MAWIKIEDTLPDHRKVSKLASLLKIDRDAAVGKLVRLWLWVFNNREDGVIFEDDAETISDVMRYPGKAQKLLDSLATAGFLDPCGDEYIVHGWIERMQLLLEKREREKNQTRERVRRYRERKKELGNAECNALPKRDVTENVTQCNAPRVEKSREEYINPSLSVSQSVSLKSNRADGQTDRRTLRDVEDQVEAQILLESYDRDVVDAILIEILNAQNGQDQELAETSRHLSFEHVEHVILAVQNAGALQNPTGYIRTCLRNSLLDVAARNQF